MLGMNGGLALFMSLTLVSWFDIDVVCDRMNCSVFYLFDLIACWYNNRSMFEW
jgi:hypothetical protein